MRHIATAPAHRKNSGSALYFFLQKQLYIDTHKPRALSGAGSAQLRLFFQDLYEILPWHRLVVQVALNHVAVGVL